MDIKIANRLVELRKKNGMSQEDIAERLGLSRQAVSRWERAESAPDMDNLVNLSKIYEISLDHLLDLNSTPINHKSKIPQNLELDEKKEKPDTLLSQIPFPFVIPVFIVWGMFGLHEGYNWLGKHKPNAMQRFPFPIIIVTIHLLIGFLFNGWHPGWVVYLTIPVYYTIAALIKRK